MLSGIERLYLVQEPDQGGTTFVSHLVKRLAQWRWPGTTCVVRLPKVKDPSDLYQQDRAAFRAAFQKALEQAEPGCLQQARLASVSSSPAPGTTPAMFSLRDLLVWELPAVRWAVPETLPEGLTLLAGKPKLGKSWLALSLALSIAAGGVALGTHPVARGDVLYLALEENARRLQARARQLLTSMTKVPNGLDFALEWPRLAEGGLSCLENYLKTHPDTRLLVIDTWAKVAPRTDTRRCTQYEGDYDALSPLKRLAETYHVSILAVHHLRKTGASDVLDEITGSTGMTGAVDGTLILKRERGQQDATLFVTGRDIEREQELALRFDATTALWSVLGSAEEVGRTQARQEILALLREQPEGMTPREIAGGLEKNYHTTRSILRKMEETGEVTRRHGRYLIHSGERNQQREPKEPLQENDAHKEQLESRQTMDLACAGRGGSDNQESARPSDETDDSDYADYGSDTSHGVGNLVKQQPDDTDYADYGNDTADTSSSEKLAPGAADNGQQEMKSISLCKQEALSSEDQQQEEPAVISGITVINRHHCNQRNQWHVSAPSMDMRNRLCCEENQSAGAEPGETTLQKSRCPHHPRARLVRFDPSGQAWCDRLECWDCYRLMKIGEVLEYRPLKEQGGRLLIEEGMEAWATYVRTQRAFLVTWAIQKEGAGLAQAYSITGSVVKCFTCIVCKTPVICVDCSSRFNEFSAST
jgi:hypothetical protein